MAMLAFLRRAAQRSSTVTSAPVSMTRTRHASLTAAPARTLSAAPARTLSAASQFSSQTQAIASAPRASQPPAAPAHLSGDVTGVLAGVAVVGALVGVGKMWWDASSSSSPAIGPVRSVDDISRDDIANFFVDLKASITQLFSQLPEIDAQFRQHLKSQNVELGDEEYKQTLLQQLFDVLQNIEQQVVAARGWNRDTFALAMERFADDAEIAQLQKELQVLMHSVFPPPQIPDHITPEKTLEILTVLTAGMEVAMVEMLKHARAEGITDPAKAMEEFQQIYLDQVEQITFDTMKNHDVSSDMFNVALQKFYGELPDFRKKVEHLYAQQADSFRRLGLNVDVN